MTEEVWNLWDSGTMCLFMLDGGGQPKYLPCIGVENIDWPEEKSKKCEYCGAEYTGTICPSCGNPASGKTVYSMGEAIAILSGPMPRARVIFHLPEGTTIDAVNCPCGRPRDAYSERDVVLRLADCKIIRRELPNLSNWRAEDQNLVELYVSVRCEVELYTDGVEESCTR